MRAEIHSEILQMLRALCRHFAAASLSLSPSRELDSLRVVTAAAIAAVADAVMRVGAAVSPSVASLHYAGLASGPLAPFGFDALPALRKETAKMAQTDPTLALVRAALLEYFDAQRAWLRPDHTLFAFDRSMAFGSADALYMEQVALQAGLPSAAQLLPRYLSGDEPDLLEQQPEVAVLRDVSTTHPSLQPPAPSPQPPAPSP